jgi:hypothetical protein
MKGVIVMLPKAFMSIVFLLFLGIALRFLLFSWACSQFSGEKRDRFVPLAIGVLIILVCIGFVRYLQRS